MKPTDFCLHVVESNQLRGGAKKTYLVQSGSDLLMLIKVVEKVSNSNEDDYDYDIVYQTLLAFELYKFNVGNVAILAGCNYSVSVTLTSSTSLKPNYIYFTDDEDVFYRLVKEGTWWTRCGCL